MRTSLLLGLALTTSLVAQDAPPRAESIITSTAAAITQANSIRVSSPKEILPANPSLGLAATPKVVYVAYPDVEQNNPNNPLVNQPGIAFRRSTNGGQSFEPASFPFLGAFAEGDIRFGNSQDRFRLISCGHEVYIVFLSTLANPSDPLSSDGVQRMYVAGSQDQGQNWQLIQVATGVDAPLSTGDRFSAVGGFFGSACSNGRLHLAFLGQYRDDTGNRLGFAQGALGSSQFNEDGWYQAVAFSPMGTLVRVFPEERQLEAVPTGTFDTDSASIAADGLAVTIAYQDTSAGMSFQNSSNNDTWSVSSLDGGLNFTAPFNHTNFLGAGSSIDFFTAARNHGLEVIVTMQHNEDGGPGGTFADQAFFSYSSDGGQNFTTVKQLGYQSDGDLDAHLVDFVGQDKVWYTAVDQSFMMSGSGTNENEIVCQVSTVSELIAGTPTPIMASRGLGGGGTFLFTQDHSGDNLAVCWRNENLGFIGWSYAVSDDCGASWQVFDGDDDNVGEVFDGDITVTTSGDIVSVHREDDLGAPNVFISGLKFPYLVDNSATTLSLDVVGANPGETLLLLPSLNTSGGPFSIPAGIPQEVGVEFNFSVDAVTGSLIGNPLFVTIADQAGEASFFWSNFATIINADIAVMVGSLTGPTWTRGYSDQIIQNP